MSRPLKPLHPVLCWALFVVGMIAVGLGVIGIFVPLLPTVPFLLLALACFARSSQRFYSWLRDHVHLGPLLRPYLQKEGIPRGARLKAIGLLWASIGFSVLFLIEAVWVRGGLLVIGLCVTLYLLRLPTAKNLDQEEVR